MDRALTRAGLGLGNMDRIEFMESFGVVIAKGTPDEVRENRAVIDAYLGSELV